MNEAKTKLCRCTNCQGSKCTCGCQRAVSSRTCDYGSQCRCAEAYTKGSYLS